MGAVPASLLGTTDRNRVESWCINVALYWPLVTLASQRKKAFVQGRIGSLDACV